MDIDCAEANKAFELARQKTLYGLAKQVLYNSYTPGIQDSLLLNSLKNKEYERNAEQTFKIIEVGGKFLVGYWHGGFLGESFKKESDALTALVLCQKAFKAGEEAKMKSLCECIGVRFEDP